MPICTSMRGSIVRASSVVAAVAALAAFGVGPAAADGSTVVFSGSDFKEDAAFTYVGGVHALNGDLGRDGFLLRVFGGYGEYQYATGNVIGGNVETDLVIVDAGVGYQIFGGGLRFSAYASASYEDHDQSPEDFTNPVRGSEWGFKGQGEVETLADSPFYFGAIGSYSTAFDSYWVRGRAGLPIGHGLILGPEIVGLGAEDFDQVRYGAFLSGLPTIWSLVFGGDSKMSVSVGYADTTSDDNGGRGGDDSVYGTISSSFPF